MIGNKAKEFLSPSTSTQDLIRSSPDISGAEKFYTDAGTYGFSDPEFADLGTDRTIGQLYSEDFLKNAPEFKPISTTGPTYGELIKKAGSFENVPLSERFNAVKDLSSKALTDLYTKPIINPKTGETTNVLDKNAVFSTLIGASSYFEALQLAKKAGITEEEFSEEDYQRLKVDPEKKRFTEALKPESFGIRPQAAGGGPMGSEIPVRQNQGGITELDLRAKGGYIPVGIKEKADDVPAMLSKNEFVFTADAVRGAGGGNINKGAKKMYKLMKSLEKKVKKMKKVA
jgi:hypothetical protein